MTDRKSKDAWAGIVDLDDDAPSEQTAGKSQNMVSPTLTDSDTDVDKLPAKAKALLIERSVTQKDPLPESVKRKPLAVRTKPIVERHTQSIPSNQSPERPSIELPLPEAKKSDSKPADTPSLFPQHESLEGLEETQNKSWVPESKGSWKDYREVGLILGAGLLTALFFIVLSAKDDPKPESTSVSKSVAKQRLERIKRSRSGQLPKTKTENKVSTESVKPPPIIKQATEPAPKEDKQDQPAEESAKASAPMLSILSTPLGAMVEIDGTVYGKTPLIIKSPKTEGPMKVRLHLSHHKKLETTIMPNEDGHYEANLNLESK